MSSNIPIATASDFTSLSRSPTKLMRMCWESLKKSSTLNWSASLMSASRRGILPSLAMRSMNCLKLPWKDHPFRPQSSTSKNFWMKSNWSWLSTAKRCIPKQTNKTYAKRRGKVERMSQQDPKDMTLLNINLSSAKSSIVPLNLSKPARAKRQKILRIWDSTSCKKM